MPNYDYKCSVCGGVQEIYKELGDSMVPTCCSTSMEKMFSAVPAHFRGGGWGGSK